MKTKITGELTAVLYGLPIALIIFPPLISIISTVDENISTFFPFLIFLWLCILGVWIFFRQCKNLYFDSEYLYINSALKNKAIRRVKLKSIKRINSILLFQLIKVVYLDDNGNKKNVHTIVDKNTVVKEIGFENWPGYQFLNGKPISKVEILKKAILNSK